MSDATPILHMLSPQKHMSPFDVNMAADAGCKVIVPYINVALEEVTALTQDAIFSRPPNYGVRTGFFIGGKDAILALDMMDAAQKAMVPPFRSSIFADPAGSFTTAAAMVACVERVLKQQVQQRLERHESRRVRRHRRRRLRLLHHRRTRGCRRHARRPSRRRSRRQVGRSLEAALRCRPHAVRRDRGTEARDHRQCRSDLRRRRRWRAGRSRSEHKALAKKLLVVADVNAVPPPGVEGMELFMDGAPLPGCKALGVGPLAIGDIKYKTESACSSGCWTSNEAVRLRLPRTPSSWRGSSRLDGPKRS